LPVAAHGNGGIDAADEATRRLLARVPATVSNWARLLLALLASWSFRLLALVLVLACACQVPHGGATSAVYPLSLFCLFVPDSNAAHRAARTLLGGAAVAAGSGAGVGAAAGVGANGSAAPFRRWRMLSLWAVLCIALKVVFLLPVWCYTLTTPWGGAASPRDCVYGLSMQPACPASTAPDGRPCERAALVQPLALLGFMYPPSAAAANSGGERGEQAPTVLMAVRWDLAVLLALLLHGWALGSHLSPRDGRSEEEEEEEEGTETGDRMVGFERPEGKAAGGARKVLSECMRSLREAWARMCPLPVPAQWAQLALERSQHTSGSVRGCGGGGGGGGDGSGDGDGEAGDDDAGEGALAVMDGWWHKPGADWGAYITAVELLLIPYIFLFFTDAVAEAGAVQNDGGGGLCGGEGGSGAESTNLSAATQLSANQVRPQLCRAHAAAAPGAVALLLLLLLLLLFALAFRRLADSDPALLLLPSHSFPLAWYTQCSGKLPCW
jgi:hypothetical protein